MYKALVIRVKVIYKNYNSSYSFNENSVVLLNQKNKLLGTRIFGARPKKLRYTKFSKLIALSSGLLS
jgi:ribosomal protein L14